MSLLEVPQTIAGFSVGDTVSWFEDGSRLQDEVRSVDQHGLTTARRRLEWNQAGLGLMKVATRPAPVQDVQMVLPLSDDERSTLEQCEEVIERTVRSFVECGTALLTIRDGRLYRENHGTFEHYLNDKWGMSRQQGYRLMDAAEVVSNLSPHGDILPAMEAQVRPLAQLGEDQQQPAWERAVEIAGGEQPTGPEVRQAVDEIKYDYRGFEPKQLIHFDDGAGNRRQGHIDRLWQGRLLTKTNDGGLEGVLVGVDPATAQPGPSPTPCTPFGRCNHLLPEGVSDPDGACGKPAVAPGTHEFEDRLCKEHAAQREAAQREAAQRVADMAATAGVPEITDQLISGTNVLDPVDEAPGEVMSDADQDSADYTAGAPQDASASPVVRSQAEIAAENADKRIAAAEPPTAESTPAAGTKPRALMGAEEILNEQKGGGVTTPSTIGAAVLDGPVTMAMVYEDCAAWLRADGLLVKDFLGRLKAAAYLRGQSAAELLTQLETL